MGLGKCIASRGRGANWQPRCGPRPPFPSVGCLYLVGVRVEIKVLEEAGCKFAEEEIVGLVDCPHAPVRVVVGAGAGAEGPHCRGTEGSP